MTLMRFVLQIKFVNLCVVFLVLFCCEDLVLNEKQDVNNSTEI